MPMRQEPAANGQPDYAQDEQLIADNQARQVLQGDPSEHERGAGGEAANDRLERRPDQ